MSDDYDEVDELEKDDDQEEEEVAETADEAESEAPAERGKREPAAVRDLAAEHSIAARQKEREEMERQIQEFLARGGKIAQIEPNVTADPPRKPDSDYGGRAI